MIQYRQVIGPRMLHPVMVEHLDSVTSTKPMLGASTSITSTSCSLALSSWFLIPETAFFKRLATIQFIQLHPVQVNEYSLSISLILLKGFVFGLILLFLLVGPTMVSLLMALMKTTLDFFPGGPLIIDLIWFCCCSSSRYATG